MKQKGIPTWLMWLTGIIAVPAALFICVLGFWLIDRQPPITAVSGRFLGWDESVPRRGHVLWGAIRVRDDCEGTIHRYIVDGEIVRLEPRKWVMNDPIDPGEGIPTTWDAPFDVPPHLNHDAKYRNRFTFICNPIHKFSPIIVTAPDVAYHLRDEDKVVPYQRSDAEPEPPVAPWSE